MKTKLVPMLAGLLVLFSFGSVRNAFAGSFDFDGSRSVRPASFDFTNGFRNFNNFDVAVTRDFDRNGNFDFANFDRNRSGFDFVGNFDNRNA